MDLTGKTKLFCTVEKCCAPRNKQPFPIYDLSGICRHCRNANPEFQNEDVNEQIRQLEIEETQKSFIPDSKPVQIFVKNPAEVKRQEERKAKKRKGTSKRGSTLKVKNYKEDEAKQKEYAAMKKYWDDNSDEFGGCVCEESGRYIPHFHIGNVHHILTKGANKKAAADIENLCILTAEMHSLAHSNQSKMKLNDYFEEVKIKMKRKYSQFGSIDILENQNKKIA